MAAVAAAILIVIGIVVATSGGEKEEEPVAVEQNTIDIEAQRLVNRADSLIKEGDNFIASHDVDKFDAKYKKIEEYYIDALHDYNQVIAQGESLKNKAIADLASVGQAKAKSSLINIYRGLKKESADIGLEEYARPYLARAEAIMPIIDIEEDLQEQSVVEPITTQDNEQDN